jgi:glycosyltransferase involved in cell wall biosynthesis
MADKQGIDVLHLIGTLSPGGAERNLHYLAPQMVKSRFRYGMCCVVRRGDLADEIERIGIPVWELGFRKRYILSTIWRLSRLLRQENVKVLHTHLFVPGLVGRLAGLLAGTPVMITHEHGKTLWKRWYHRWFERIALPITDLRIAVSHDILNLRLEHEHTPPSKIRLVYNAVDPVVFETPERVRDEKRKELALDGCFVVGTVGRLVDAKSFDVLLGVAREVCAIRPDARFVVIGEGPLGEDLRRLCDSYGLSGKVLFTGKRSDIPELMAAMDLYFITSKREGLPLSLIEAMMSGKAIVATSVGGIPDTISHNEDGLLTEPGDRTGMVRAVLALADDPTRRLRLGARARKRAVAHYSPSKVLEELEHIYLEFWDPDL